MSENEAWKHKHARCINGDVCMFATPDDRVDALDTTVRDEQVSLEGLTVAGHG